MTNLQDTPSAGPLTADDLRKHWPPRRCVPSCSANCRQGRDSCPSPDACQLPAGNDHHIGWGAALPAALVLSVLCALGLLHWWLR